MNPPSLSMSTRVLRGLVLGLLGYWFVYSLAMPVTIWDAHTYNLARLLVVRYGGLFGNSVWNDYRQMAFPWTFDAVHYPFLFIHWGYALPSFACLVGILAIVFHVTRDARDDRTAWACCLGILALPTVVFQASSVKNDLAVIFALGTWYYALWRFQREDRTRYVVLAALGLTLAAGAKSTGVPLGLLLSIFTLWQLRRQWRQATRFVVFAVSLFLLFGSVEIYVNNCLLFNRILGPPAIDFHRNPSGIPGAVANFVRYVLGSVNFGYPATAADGTLNHTLEKVARTILSLPMLSNKGYNPFHSQWNDGTLVFLRGGEAGSDFGPVGFVALLVSTWVLFRPTRFLIPWRLSALGFASLLSTCAMVGWMPWNMRFLMLPFILFTLVLVLVVTQLQVGGFACRAALLAMAVYAAFWIPCREENKPPGDICRALLDRDTAMTKEYGIMREVIAWMRGATDRIGKTPVAICGGQDSWTLPFLEMHSIHPVPCPRPAEAALRCLARQSNTDRVYVLFVACPRDPAGSLTLLKKFALADTTLYEWCASRNAAAEPSAMVPAHESSGP